MSVCLFKGHVHNYAHLLTAFAATLTLYFMNEWQLIDKFVRKMHLACLDKEDLGGDADRIPKPG